MNKNIIFISSLKFRITVKLNNLFHDPLPLDPPNITAHSLPLHLSRQNLSINTIDIQKKPLDIQHSTIHIQVNLTRVSFNNFSSLKLFPPCTLRIHISSKSFSPNRTTRPLSYTLSNRNTKHRINKHSSITLFATTLTGL